MNAASALGFAAAVLAVWGLTELAIGSLPSARHRGPGVIRGALALVDALSRVGREGRDPGAAERRRLLAAGSALAFCLGAIVAGPLVGLMLAAAGPWAVARVLRARRRHYRRAVDSGAAVVATALADALSAGHALRAAVCEAARGADGQAGHELRRTAAELVTGAATEDALEALGARTRSPRMETVVAACLMQRAAGGDLARLLRECTEAFGDQARLEDEARAATAQARFTGVIVVLLPLAGAVLAELASPGFLVGLASSFLTAWLVGLALAMQAAGAVVIHRLSRVRW